MSDTIKWIRVMADYSSTGLWHRDGANVDASYLPISEALHHRLSNWCRSYEENDDYLPVEQQKGMFNLTMFSAEGLAIAQAIKAELPTWTVVYFDEAGLADSHHSPEASRGMFEYEV